MKNLNQELLLTMTRMFCAKHNQPEKSDNLLLNYLMDTFYALKLELEQILVDNREFLNDEKDLEVFSFLVEEIFEIIGEKIIRNVKDQYEIINLIKDNLSYSLEKDLRKKNRKNLIQKIWRCLNLSQQNSKIFESLETPNNTQQAMIHLFILGIFMECKIKANFNLIYSQKPFLKLYRKLVILEIKDSFFENLKSHNEEKFSLYLSILYNQNLVNDLIKTAIFDMDSTLSFVGEEVFGNKQAISKTINGIYNPFNIYEIKAIAKYLGLEQGLKDAQMCYIEAQKLNLKFILNFVE